MFSRAYFASEMLAAAELEDERREQRDFQSDMRWLVGNPIDTISDAKFIKLYRLTKQAFIDLCGLMQQYSNLKPTQRVSLETKVLCALLFYAHGDYQRVVGEANHFSQEAMSVYIQEVTEALNKQTVLRMFVKFPTTRQERDIIKQSFYRKYQIPGVIGCIDGSHFKLFKPKQEEEHLYYCRKHYHSLNVQMICDTNCKILAVNLKFGGATHDAFIWENSNINNYIQSLHRNNERVWLLGDSGYPQRPWIMTPYTEAAPHSIEETYNKKHTTARVLIENTFGRLKNRWRCLSKDRVLHYAPTKCAQIITACCVLHNIAVEYNVPDPVEHSTDEPSSTEEQSDQIVNESQANSELILGRALRDQLARKIAGRHTNQ